MLFLFPDEVERLKMGSLTMNSIVEVSRDKECFKGAWFVAKILEEGKRKGKVLVQYQNLLSENQPLTECVDVSSIRPLPPPPVADQTYEPHDVVDAFHHGRWWKGVVSKVEFLEDKTKSTRYTVVLESPPQVFNFNSADLRFRLVYIGGRWMQPPKQQRMKGLKISKGMAVEVNFGTENVQEAWFPAIVAEEVGFNSFLVEYRRSTNDGKDGHMKETVDSFHIRTPPPKLEGQNFAISECIEAFHDSCWKKGTIITTLSQGRYDVFLESGKEKMQFSQSEIRRRLLWTNGKWVTGFKETPNRTHCVGHSAHADNTEKHSEVVVSVKSSSKAWDHSEEESSCKKTSNAMDHGEEKLNPKNWKRNLVDTQKESNAFGKQDKDAEISLKKCSMRYLVDTLKESNAFGRQDKGEEQNVFEGTSGEMDFEDCVSKEAELSTVMHMENGGMRTQQFEHNVDFEDCASIKAEFSTVMDMEFEDVMVRTSSIVPIADDTAKGGASCDADIDNQDPSTCFGSEEEGNVENFNQSSETIVQADNELEKSREMPFTKSSKFWQYVDSLDVFSILPQKPHFSPLFQCNETTHEGLAIAHMLNFSSLVENISKLRVENSKEYFDHYLEALTDLELLGFDVKVVVERINKLLSIKTRLEELNNQSKDINSKVAQCDGDKARKEEEINAIDKMIKELKEQRAVRMSKKAMKDAESNRLGTDASIINGDILNAMLEFQSEAAAPW